MTSTILRNMCKAMDDLGITKCGVDENGNVYVPASLVDGHISFMEEDFLSYVNDEISRWMTMLGAPYGAEHWQLHELLFSKNL